VLVYEFSSGLALVEQRARCDDRHSQEGDSRAFKSARQLEHHAPGGKNQKRVHQVLPKHGVRQVSRRAATRRCENLLRGG
jgi:hypothetical protein